MSSHSKYFSSTEDATKLLSKLYLTVIFNWPVLSQNNDIMQVLDMESNILCKTHKELYPSLRDSFIQCHILTQMISIWIIMSMPIETVYNGGVEYLRTYVDKEIELKNNINTTNQEFNQASKNTEECNINLINQMKNSKAFEVD